MNDEHHHSHNWKNDGVRVIKGDQLDPSTAQTPGMFRQAAVNAARVGAQKIWAGTVSIAPNAKTGVHHHGDLESVIYVVSGRARMRWGDHLEYVAEAGPGDFIYVPPFVPHQEINADPGQTLNCVLVRLGQRGGGGQPRRHRAGRAAGSGLLDRPDPQGQAMNNLSGDLTITRLTVRKYAFTAHELGRDYNGFNHVYLKGSTVEDGGYVLTIETKGGITGEYVGGNAVSYAQVGMVAQYLIGRNALQREQIWNDLKRALRKQDRFGMGPIDCALWDIAGKAYGVPVAELLGGWKTALPCYASTYHGDDNGGLDSPEAFGEFAVQCREMGYPAFKIHGWGNGPIAREVACVLATRKAVGDGMDLMIDPACEYETWADALKVGRACDEANYFWLEDPYKDGGQSAFGHRKLRQLIKTPILMGEHIRGMELRVDNIVAEGTDICTRRRRLRWRHHRRDEACARLRGIRT